MMAGTMVVKPLEVHNENLPMMPAPPPLAGAIPLPCPVCQEVMLDNDTLQQHVSKHLTAVSKLRTVNRIKRRDNTHFCEICGTTVKNLQLYASHMKRKHQKDIPRCEVCSKLQPNQRELLKHMNQHSASVRMTCELCDQEFENASKMTDHLVEHLGSGKKCPVCFQVYASNMITRKHMKIHSGERAHKCGICEMYFFQEWDVARHVLTKSHMKKKQELLQEGKPAEEPQISHSLMITARHSYLRKVSKPAENKAKQLKQRAVQQSNNNQPNNIHRSPQKQVNKNKGSKDRQNSKDRQRSKDNQRSKDSQRSKDNKRSKDRQGIYYHTDRQSDKVKRRKRRTKKVNYANLDSESSEDEEAMCEPPPSYELRPPSPQYDKVEIEMDVDESPAGFLTADGIQTIRITAPTVAQPQYIPVSLTPQTLSVSPPPPLTQVPQYIPVSLTPQTLSVAPPPPLTQVPQYIPISLTPQSQTLSVSPPPPLTQVPQYIPVSLTPQTLSVSPPPPLTQVPQYIPVSLTPQTLSVSPPPPLTQVPQYIPVSLTPQTLSVSPPPTLTQVPQYIPISLTPQSQTLRVSPPPPLRQGPQYVPVEVDSNSNDEPDIPPPLRQVSPSPSEATRRKVSKKRCTKTPPQSGGSRPSLEGAEVKKVKVATNKMKKMVSKKSTTKNQLKIVSSYSVIENHEEVAPSHPEPLTSDPHHVSGATGATVAPVAPEAPLSLPTRSSATVQDPHQTSNGLYGETIGLSFTEPIMIDSDSEDENEHHTNNVQLPQTTTVKTELGAEPPVRVQVLDDSHLAIEATTVPIVKEEPSSEQPKWVMPKWNVVSKRQMEESIVIVDSDDECEVNTPVVEAVPSPPKKANHSKSKVNGFKQHVTNDKPRCIQQIVPESESEAMTHSCVECGMDFTNQALLDKHMSLHSEVEDPSALVIFQDDGSSVAYMCVACCNMFDDRAELDKHKKSCLK